MSRPIQTLAPGYLGLLGMKNEGKLPADLIDQVQPVTELLPFYLMGNRESLPVTAANNGLAISNYVFAELNVPANETWWVHGYSVQVNVPAAQTWAGSPIHYNRNTLAIHVGRQSSGGAAAAQTVQTESIGGFFAAGGDLFGYLTGASTGAGAINGFGFLCISRFLA